MSYLKFSKEQIVNLEFSLGREVLRTNRSGSYMSTTLAECNTRKYHGMLVCPVPAFGGERYVLLSALDLTVVSGDKSFNMGIREYNGERYCPKGHKYVENYSFDTIPGRTLRVGSVKLKVDRLLVHFEEQLLVRYTILEAPEPIKLQVRPFLTFRNSHELTHANMDANTKVEYIKNGVKSKMYEGFPYLNMQFSVPAEFVHVPDWYYDVIYSAEKRRGYDYKEDLFTPGFFEFEAKEGDVIIFSASTKEENPAGFKTKFTRWLNSKTPRDSFEHCLMNAALQFIEKHGEDTFLVAGYPWFGSWGRDTFISLPGLATAKYGLSLYKDVLDTQVRKMKDGLFPNMGTEGNYAFNSVDAPMWFVWAVQQYKKAGAVDYAKRYYKPIVSILSAFKNGRNNGITMRENGLIYADVPGKSLTWMDAIVNGQPVTPRNGYDVEINALWYNAICFALDLAKKLGDDKFIDEYKYLPELIKKSFIEIFWLREKGYLADYVNDAEGANAFVRPNMLVAASLPYSMLTKEQMKGVVDVASRELVTVRGLRTLSPKNNLYKGIYTGCQEARDLAYHQGTVWPWLYGPYCEAYLKVYGKSGVQEVKRLIYGMEEVMGEHGLTTISEVYDGDPPYQPHGAISQAWSVGEVLRIMDLLRKDYKGL
ncbi:MAG: glycogen debranching enzyme family protein [Bacteroidales bacterium]|nr:glycogen debranching enzyme family protein [Bacteroidales bacterium]